MRRSRATLILLPLAVALTSARPASPPPAEEPGTPIEGGCRAVALRTGDTGPATVLLVRSDRDRFMVVLPFAEDWQLTCAPERHVSPGADRMLSGQSDHIRMFSSVILHRSSGEFDEQAHLTEVLVNLRTAMASQGLIVDEDAIVSMRDHLVLEYRVHGSLSTGLEGTEYEVWSTRLREDGVEIDSHLSWDASGLTLSEDDVAAGRAALRGAVAMTKVLPAPTRPARAPKDAPHHGSGPSDSQGSQ